MKPKIVLATGIFPPDIGGPATMLKALAADLTKHSFSCKVVTYANQRKHEKLCFGENSVEVNKINRNCSSLIRYFNFGLRLWKLSQWADLIYATDIYSVGYFSYLLKKFFGKKYVIRFAGDSAWEKAVSFASISDDLLTFQEKNYAPAIERLKTSRTRILQNADRVIVVSQFMAKIAKLIGVSENKIELIYNSIDFVSENPTNRILSEVIKKKYPTTGKTIMTACRLTPWKGVQSIIKMLPHLLETVGPTQLLIIGDGSERANLENLRNSLNLAQQVHFVGNIAHDQIFSYFNVADLFILNSQYEGLSHTLLEGMNAGVPIICSNIGGNPEVITDGKDGLLVPYLDQQALIQATEKVLLSPDFAKSLVVNARQKLQNFNWAEVIRKTEQIFEELCIEKTI